MNDLIARIRAAQIRAAEQVVIDSLPAELVSNPPETPDGSPDAMRWQFFEQHYADTLGGIPLHEWLTENAPHRGSMRAAMDWAINYHENSERHIYEPPAASIAPATPEGT